MEPWLDASLFAVVQFLMLLGLFGMLVPMFPGIAIMWLAALGYGIATGWGALGVILFILITLFMIAGAVSDNILMGAGARKEGASWVSIGASLVAGVVGTLLWPPFGGIIASPLVVVLIEYNRARDWSKVWQTMRSMLTGWGVSIVVKFGFGLLMMGAWWVWVWLG